MYFPDLETRAKIRNVVLNHFSKNEEVWVLHPKCEFLLVSNFGRLKNIVTDHEYARMPNRQGYLMSNLVFADQRGRRCYMVARAVCETFFPYSDDIEMFLEANHINGNKNDNSIYNLEWLTRQENLKHARENGLFKKNTAELGYCKYTEKDIDKMKEMRSNGETLVKIAKDFNGCKTYISNLIKNKTRRQTKCQR